MNELVVYTPTKDWTILWSLLLSIMFLCMKLLKADEMEKKTRMEKKNRLMDNLEALKLIYELDRKLVALEAGFKSLRIYVSTIEEEVIRIEEKMN